MKLKTWKDWALLLFWAFVFGSIFGYVHEMVLHFLKHGFWESRQGLLFGPFSQVYGLGAMFFVVTIAQLKDWKAILLTGTFLGGFFEWVCSFAQEKIFGTISWDYSDYFMNFGGRTSLFHAVCWGVIGLIFVKLIYPILFDAVKHLASKKGRILTIALASFLAVDIILTIIASIRQKQRQQGIEAQTVFGEMIDTCFPDSFMNWVYPNKQVKERS